MSVWFNIPIRCINIYAFVILCSSYKRLYGIIMLYAHLVHICLCLCYFYVAPINLEILLLSCCYISFCAYVLCLSLYYFYVAPINVNFVLLS
jgi:hypothetical protein